MIEILKNFLEQSYKFILDIDPNYLAGSLLFSYIAGQIYLDYHKLSNPTSLIEDLNDQDFTYNFFYEIPFYFKTFYPTKTMFYNVSLSRSMDARLLQELDKYKELTLYDLFIYNTHFKKDLITHRISYNLPDFADTYFHLKQSILFHETLKYFWIENCTFNENWFRIKWFIWVPPEFDTRKYWVTKADCFDIYYNYIWSSSHVWIIFFFIMIFFFFLNLQLNKIVKS